LKKLEITDPMPKILLSESSHLKTKVRSWIFPGITVYTQPQYHYKRTQNCEHRGILLKSGISNIFFLSDLHSNTCISWVITRVTKAAVLATSTLDVSSVCLQIPPGC